MPKIDKCTKLRAVILYNTKKGMALRDVANELGISKSSVQRIVDEYGKIYIPDEIGKCEKKIDWIKRTTLAEKYYSAEDKERDICELNEEINLLRELSTLRHK